MSHQSVKTRVKNRKVKSSSLISNKLESEYNNLCSLNKMNEKRVNKLVADSAAFIRNANLQVLLLYLCFPTYWSVFSNKFDLK
jgi:hypothetical protein